MCLEARKLGQSNESPEALKILAATEYKKNIKCLDTLFRNLENRQFRCQFCL